MAVTKHLTLLHPKAIRKFTTGYETKINLRRTENRSAEIDFSIG